ncbi:MAG: SIS domain-containing protein [Candidatus Omnitrophota bacterium]
MDFLNEYFDGFKGVLNNFLENEENKDGLNKAVKLLQDTKGTDRKVYLIGNGGSAAIAEHMAVDFTKCAGLKAVTISGSPMLTAFSNDYGYETAFQKAIEFLANPEDILIAISSSGNSANILNACAAAKDEGMKVITFSGFDKSNPLRDFGDFNFWVDSKSYGYVEIMHNLLIHYMNDACMAGILSEELSVIEDIAVEDLK